MIDELPLGVSAVETDEARRLAVLHALHLLDTPPEAEFDTIVACAQRLLGCKIALLSLVDGERQWFKAKTGLDVDETPRAQSFCAHAIGGQGVFVVPDATRDRRFADNPLVSGAPGIRFYAGIPISAEDPAGGDGRQALGTVCVIDDTPRELTADQADLLRKLGALAESLIAARTLAARAAGVADERQRALQRLDITHRQFRQAERMANIGSWRLTLDDDTVEWSDQVYVIHGLPQGEQPHLDAALTFYPPHARAEIADALARTIETGEPFSVEADFITAKGLERRVRSMGELELRDGKPTAVIGMVQDITGRYRMEQQLRHTASRDDLTGLANRARFNEVADEAIAAARRTDGRVALALIDLDHFKAVNDSQGHLVGDEVLRALAGRLGGAYLGGAFAARLGGDEFVLLFTPPPGPFDLPTILAQLSADLGRLAVFDEGRIVVSATIGAAWLDGAQDRAALLHRADLALYGAKRACRGTWRIFAEDEMARTG